MQFRFWIFSIVTHNQNNTFMTSIYRKKIFTGLYTRWNSFPPRKYRINPIRSLTYRYYRLCLSGSLPQSALKDLRKLPLQNGYPQSIINCHINNVLNENRHQHSRPVSTCKCLTEYTGSNCETGGVFLFSFICCDFIEF